MVEISSLLHNIRFLKATRLTDIKPQLNLTFEGYTILSTMPKFSLASFVDNFEESWEKQTTLKINNIQISITYLRFNKLWGFQLWT